MSTEVRTAPVGHHVGWPALSAGQQPTWPDPEALAQTLAILSRYPPLVSAEECEALTGKLAAVSRGAAFVLQGGDCAETLGGVTGAKIRDRIKTILQMAVVLTYGAGMPVVKVGRMAGQFAKPRSCDTETRDGVSLPSYRGDMVNGAEFTPAAREHDPLRLLRAYHASAATLKLMRALACGAADAEELRRAELYASHEALVLDYERALVRRDSRTGRLYDTSAHFLWVGERTRELTGAHIDFVSRVHNPIGVKLGPTATRDDVLRLVERLDPERTPGRLTFITRMGAARIGAVLPGLLDAVRAEAGQVGWVCDPMHGNTFISPSGHKTRRFDDVVAEVRGFFAAHRQVGTWPGGIHVELTDSDVTECVGGSDPIDLGDVGLRYETVCDPRLNQQQSLELAFLVAQMLDGGTR